MNKVINGENLPSVKEVRLMTTEEYDELEENLPMFNCYETGAFYVISADGQNVYLADWSCCEEIEPDYEDMPPRGPEGTALRPIIIFNDSKLKDGTELEAGDIAIINGRYFTALSDTIIIPHDAAYYDDETLPMTLGHFDDETSVYEDSLAKKRVDKWFEYNVKYYLG